MKLRYKELFKVGFTTAYYVDGKAHDDIVLEPTTFCKQQMRRFKILGRNTTDGISLYYEASPLTNDATAVKPINAEEKFAFKAVVKNADLWYYADVNGWQQDRVYFIKNAAYNTTGDINVHTGALNTSVLHRPLTFVYDLPLQAAQSLLEIRDASNTLIKSIVVRALASDETAGKKEGFLVDLKVNADGLYTLRHIKSGGDVDEQVYCSADYSVGTFAIVEITYKGDVAWTGVAPTQQFKIEVSTRPTDWVYEVYIRAKPMNTVLASELFIKHEPVGAEPLQTFSVITADDTAGFVQFKSDAPLKFSQQQMHLRLVKPNLVTPTDVIKMLPGPTANAIRNDGGNLLTKIIINI